MQRKCSNLVSLIAETDPPSCKTIVVLVEKISDLFVKKGVSKVNYKMYRCKPDGITFVDICYTSSR